MLVGGQAFYFLGPRSPGRERRRDRDR